MKKISLKISVLILLLIFSSSIKAQSLNARYKDGIKVYLSDDSTRYLKATGLAQIWFRYNHNNPGSAIYNTPINNTFDVGLRRVRYQIMSQVNKRTFFYTQIGINSINSLSARKTGLFFHDVTAEYAVYKNHLTLGGGLSGWNGPSRYASSGVANILCLDLPIIEEATNDLNDQFVRKLGVYAKGKIGKLDYRFSVSNAALPATGTNTAYYSPKAPKMQYQSYVMWQFFDQESNLLPYMTGSYLGKKRVLNVGAGFTHQKEAMWYRNESNDTVSTASTQFAVDVFYDAPLNKDKQNAITAYACYLNYNFGPNYVRNVGPMNTANSVVGATSFNGAGNSYPVIGTGSVFYTQAAYLFRKDLLKSQGTLQPYFSGSYAKYPKLSSPVVVYDLGVNWIMSGQNSKISLDYQSRPIFNTGTDGKITAMDRRGMMVMQYQVLF